MNKNSINKIRLSIDRFLPTSLHVIAWLTFGILLYQNPRINGMQGFFDTCGLKLGPALPLFYANYLYLIPRVLARIKILNFLIFNLILLALLSMGASAAYGILYNKPSTFFSTAIDFSKNYQLFLIMSVIIRFSVDWFGQKLRDKQRENEKLKTELNFLKAQVNPHFLFNSLNNLYALALKQSPETPDVILGISRIMRYLLYETNETQVSLNKEIEILEIYTSLQQLKVKERAGSPLIVTGDTSIQVAPLLFLPIVENVYKHGAEPQLLKFAVTREMLVFEATNRIDRRKKNKEGGVGLANLKRRLALLYPDKHQLELQEREGNFISKITLTLSK